jgi:hypothetical protein
MHALVMELVDREDLSQRIARGAIPVPVENSICAAWRPIADLYALTVQSDERIGGVCRGGDDGSAINQRFARAVPPNRAQLDAIRHITDWPRWGSLRHRRTERRLFWCAILFVSRSSIHRARSAWADCGPPVNRYLARPAGVFALSRTAYPACFRRSFNDK